MNLTQKEAIELILEFCHCIPGFWVDIPIENPLVIEFIEAGYTKLNKEYPEKHILNDNGVNLLKPYIEKISMDFIKFIEKRSLSCYDEDAIHWFSDTYGLDYNISEELYSYITLYIENHGYKRQDILKPKHGYYFRML